jgi:hypothetical protein
MCRVADCTQNRWYAVWQPGQNNRRFSTHYAIVSMWLEADTIRIYDDVETKSALGILWHTLARVVNRHLMVEMMGEIEVSMGSKRLRANSSVRVLSACRSVWGSANWMLPWP